MLYGFGIWDAEAAVAWVPWVPWAGPGAQSPVAVRPTVRCCMVGRSILNSVIDSSGMPYRGTYCNACKLSRSVLHVCLRRLVFVG